MTTHDYIVRSSPYCLNSLVDLEGIVNVPHLQTRNPGHGTKMIIF